MAVEGFVTIDHAAAVEALRNGDADISFMGALPFVLAEAQIGAVPLLSEIYRDAPSYTGRVFVRRDSGIATLADLRGRDIAFADPISESGTFSRWPSSSARGRSPDPTRPRRSSAGCSSQAAISRRCRRWPRVWSMPRAPASMPTFCSLRTNNPR